MAKAVSAWTWVRALATFRRAGVPVGGQPRQRGRLRLKVQGVARVGSRFTSKDCGITVQAGGELVIGHGVFINHGAGILCTTRIEIGDYCKIAPDVVIRDTDTHEAVPGEGVRRRPIRIGRNVWVGQRAMVMPGSSIGDNAVIAAGAVVCGDIPANVIAGGVPARPLREFDAPSGWLRA